MKEIPKFKYGNQHNTGANVGMNGSSFLVVLKSTISIVEKISTVETISGNNWYFLYQGLNSLTSLGGFT